MKEKVHDKLNMNAQALSQIQHSRKQQLKKKRIKIGKIIDQQKKSDHENYKSTSSKIIKKKKSFQNKIYEEKEFQNVRYY